MKFVKKIPFFILFTFLIASSSKNPTKSQLTDFQAYSQTIAGSSATIEMLPINGGRFKMGSPNSEKGRKPDEGELQTVEIDSFWMAKYEITWDIYELFMFRKIDKEVGERASEVNISVDAVSGATKPYVEMSFGMGKKGFPAINMTQYAAITFCKWLTAKTGHFYRLPTEAEWEYACRAGSQTAYHFGDNAKALKEYAWYKDNSQNKYQPVGQKKPNAWGIYDMHGNVAEWTMDQYTPNYSGRASINQNPWVIPDKLYPHSVRGGSWQDAPTDLRSAARRASDPSWKKRDPQLPKSRWWLTDAPFVGFRVVRPKTTPSPAEMEKYWLQAIDDI
jgi:formylglycine-generating enzyme required for sulfatase activity